METQSGSLGEIHAQMKLGQTRRASAADPLQYRTLHTSFGLMLIASSRYGLRALLPGRSENELLANLRQRFTSAALEEDHGDLSLMGDLLIAHFENPRSAFDPPLDPLGTDFQRLVWQALRDIPVGHTTSYQALAHKIDHPSAARAVATACAANPLAFIIPCHRVIAADGRLSGYRWGADLKRALLEREGAPLSASQGD